MPRIGLFRNGEPSRHWSGNPIAFETMAEARAWAAPYEQPGVLKEEHWPTKARSIATVVQPAPVVEQAERVWWQRLGKD
ncbi:hypothetical protein [Novosphingobium aquimarinum]|uniref:hypothetical protein n=1 Tax=Novosphingobium aquimarinum TaxID=2682494 RepID=UPI0012EB8B54|nr:hypothetical protein [Novosphingobium aquimarinum]